MTEAQADRIEKFEDECRALLAEMKTQQPEEST